MSTKHAEHKKTATSAEVDLLIAAEPQVTSLSCEQLCEELSNDLSILENIYDFPPKQQAAVRAAIIRAMIPIRAQMRSKHCPECQ